MSNQTNGDKELTTSNHVHADHGAEMVAPIIVSLGKKKKKQIKQLKRGKGSTMDEVMDVVEQVQANLGEAAADKIIVPVVIIYRQKPRRMPSLF